MRWPSLSRQAPRHITVAGPTEALRDRPGEPGADVPRGAVPGLLDHEQESGWQTAQRVWQASGVDWEADAPEPDYGQPDPYAAQQYSAAPNRGPYLAGSYLADADYPASARYSADDYLADADYPVDNDYPADGGYQDDDDYPAAHDDYRAIADPRAYADVDDLDQPGDLSPAHQYSAAPYPEGRHLTDAYATRPDLPVLRDPAGLSQGVGQWPVQQPAAAPQPESRATWREPRDPGGRGGPGPADRDRAPGEAGARGPARAGDRDQEPTARATGNPATPQAPGSVRAPALRWAQFSAQAPVSARGPASAQAPVSARGPVPARGRVSAQEPGPGQDPAAARDHGAQEAPPPLPRRIRQAGAGWSERPASGLASQAGPGDRDQAPPPRPPAFAQPSAFAPPSPFAPSPAFASRQALGASTAPSSTRPLGAPLSAPVAPAAPPLGEPDELFRAWQGSVREAAGGSTPWSAPRRRPRRGAGARGLGWQVVKIGVPAAVIVTVGAGAVLMLTGRANEMLATTGAQPSGQPGITAATGQPGAVTTGLVLAGYPGQHGPVGVAAMWSAGSTTMAVGYADAHPAVWRHAANGTWSLVSAAALGGLTGHLTSVAQQASGWIAVGAANENGTDEPVVFWSPDGVAWTPLPALTGIAGGGAQFLGVAAGPGGYLVVGKQGSGAKERAAFWWSADLKNWISGAGAGAPSNATAAAAVNDGFVAVGSMAGCHTIWLSADGQHWTEYDLTKPSGTTSATLNSVAVNQAGRLVAAGVATGGAGDIPIVVSSADGGVHVTQAVLSAPQGPASVTAVTATSGGFVAVGLAGSGKAQRAVEWTSRDGVTWSAATPVSSAGTSQITALTGSGGTVTGTVQRGAGPSVLALPAG